MGVLADSYQGAGAAQAFSRGMSPERMAERSQAYNDVERSRQELATRKATEPTAQDREMMGEQQTQALQQSLQQQAEMIREGNKRRSYDAFDRYDLGGGDVAHINQMLGDLTQSGSKMYGQIARVDPLTSMDVKLMDEAGINPALQKLIMTDDTVAQSYVKITSKDGSTSFGDVDSLKKVAGYNDYASKKELDRQKTQREIEYISSIGLPTTPNSREAFMSVRTKHPDLDPKSPEFKELYETRLNELRASGYHGSARNATNEEGYAERALAAEGLYPGMEGYEDRYNDYVTEYKNLNMPSKVKQDTKVVEAEKDLTDAGFWDMDFGNMSDQDRMAIEPKIRIIENMGNAKLDRKTKDQLQDVAELMQLGNKAGALTEDQTGLLDSLWYGMKQYMFDTVEGTEATAAYAALRNVSRHDLFGSVLPASERSDFVQAFGSLGQQQGPVLDKLKSYLGDLKEGFETMKQLDHPMVMKYRTGQTARQITDTIRRLDERIKMLDTVANDAPITVETTPPATGTTTLTPEREKGLDNILGGNQ